MGPKTGPKGPKIGPKRLSEGWTERVRTKMRISASRLGESTIFESRMAPTRAPKSAQSGPKVGPEGQSDRRLDQCSRTFGQEARNPAQDGRPGLVQDVGTHRNSRNLLRRKVQTLSTHQYMD